MTIVSSLTMELAESLTSKVKALNFVSSVAPMLQLSEKQCNLGLGSLTEQYVNLRGDSSSCDRDRTEHGGQVNTASGETA